MIPNRLLHFTVRPEFPFRLSIKACAAVSDAGIPVFFISAITKGFIFARNEKVSGQELFDALKAHGIYVRHWNAPRISDYLRITIGTDEQMDALVAFLKEYLKK